MPEQVTMYRAADGTLFESIQDAERHDMHKALTRQASVFMDRHVETRSISKNKATDLMVAFSLALFTDGFIESDSEITDYEHASQEEGVTEATAADE